MNRGAFAAVINNDEVLLVRSLTVPHLVDFWSLPGGVAEEGEALQACAKRETFEETSIYCKVGELIEEADNIENNIRVSIFRAEYTSGTISKDDGEIIEAGWFKLRDAINLPLGYNTKAILLAL